MFDPIVLMLVTAVRARVERVRRALARVRRPGADAEWGALSIELALLVLVLILAAGVVVAAITKLVTKKANEIGNH